MLGVLHLSQGEADKAVEELQVVLDQDPENKSAQMYMRVAKAALDKIKSVPPPDAPAES
jgi:hypothetical protein